MNILIDAPLPDKQARRIRSLSPRLRLIRVTPFGQPLPRNVLKEATIIYTTAADFDPAHAPRLRWVQTNTAATNPQANVPVFRSSIPVVNVAGAYSSAVAECAIGMLLALTRRITLGCRLQGRCTWPEDDTPLAGDDLYGATMGIVGYGSIGRQIAKIAVAAGMSVLACKRNPEIRRDDAFLLPGTGDPEGKLPKAWFGPGQITKRLRQTDVAVIALPHVPTTERLIGRKELGALPRHAYLVNVGRGGVIDEPELIRALKAEALAGAALDVFATEPLPRHNPLWKMSNVLVMPHIASWTKLQAYRATEVFIENLKRDLGGRPLLNIIDKELMY